MKTKVIFLMGFMILVAGRLVAQTQNTVKESEKTVVGSNGSTIKVKSVQWGTKAQYDAAEKNKMSNDHSDKRINAETRSNGHAFSGKGNGRKHNLKDPQPAIKQVKKNTKGLQKE